MSKDAHRLTRPEAMFLTIETIASIAIAFLSSDLINNSVEKGIMAFGMGIFLKVFIPYIIHSAANNFIKNYFKSEADFKEEEHQSGVELVNKYLFDEPIRKPLGFDWINAISGKI